MKNWRCFATVWGDAASIGKNREMPETQRRQLYGQIFLAARFLRKLFGRAFEEVEGLGCLRGDGVGGLFEIVGDFEDAGGVGGESRDLFGGIGPVDAAAAGPEVIVVLSVVVVEVELSDAGLE